MAWMKRIMSMILMALVAAVACSTPSTHEISREHEPELAESQAALTVATSAAFGTLPFSAAVHGVGGTRSLLFALVPEPSATTPVGVFASSRLTGALRGSFPPPPEGFRVPLSIKVLDAGPLGETGVALILDNRVKPAEIGMPGQESPTLYKYAFSNVGGFHATLLDSFPLPVNTVDPASGFPPNGLIFPGSIAIIPGEGVAVSDNFGALWQVRGQISNAAGSGGPSVAIPRLLDRRFVGRPSGPITAVGKIGPGSGTIGTYTLLTPLPVPPGVTPPPGLGIYPGMHSLGFFRKKNELCFSVTVPGGVYCISKALLLDNAIPYFAKSGDNPSLPENFAPSAFGGVRQVVSPPPADPDGWLMDGFDIDSYGDDENGYFMPAPSNKLFQVRLGDASCATVGPCPKTEIAHGGAVEIFNWTNELAVLPSLVPGLRVTNLVVSVGQEYDNPAVNSLLGGVERYFGPAYYGRIWLTY